MIGWENPQADAGSAKKRLEIQNLIECAQNSFKCTANYMYGLLHNPFITFFLEKKYLPLNSLI